MAAITTMHGASRQSFEAARDLLQTLIDRAPRQPVAHAWLANWHVFRTYQGWSDDPQKDARLALSHARRAHDADPDSSLALAIDGLVHTHFTKRLDIAQQRYDLAVKANPNDSLAWLLKGTLHAFKADGQRAVDYTQRAILLSPLHPYRYYYDSLAATACLANHQYEDALELAQRSLRANRVHTSTLRALAIAQWNLGRHEDARATVRRLLRLEPQLTIARYLDRTPAADFDTGREWSRALAQAGVPR